MRATLTSIPVFLLLLVLACSKPDIKELGLEEENGTIQLKFDLGDVVNISQENIGGRAITDNDTWILIGVENNSGLQEQYAVFDPAFVEGGYVDTVILELNAAASVEYTFDVVAIRRGTAGGIVWYQDSENSYININSSDFEVANDFVNAPFDFYDPYNLTNTHHYTSTDSSDIISTLEYPRLDTYYEQLELLVDTLSEEVTTLDFALDRKTFALEAILKNNDALDSITVELETLDTETLYSKHQEDSIYDLRSFKNLRYFFFSNLFEPLKVESRVNVYKEETLIFTQEDVSFEEDKVTRIEIDLGGNGGRGNSVSFNITIENQEIVRGDTVRFGG